MQPEDTRAVEFPVFSKSDSDNHRQKSKRVKAKPKKTRPTQVLPTDRITFSRQLDLLRAWAAASGANAEMVTNETVASIVSMKASTVSLANPFFSSVGLLRKVEGGYIPNPEVFQFNRAYDWNRETAAQKLAPVLRETWFAKAVLPRVLFAPLEEEEAVSVIADAAAVQPDYRSQLILLVDYLVVAGVVDREGNQIRLGKSTTNPNPPTAEGPIVPSATDNNGNHKEEPQGFKVSTAFSQPAEGLVKFDVAVRVDMREFAKWEAARIAAFFNGIAQVLSAKSDIEKSSSKG
jgi:hypothetical protein